MLQTDLKKFWFNICSNWANLRNLDLWKLLEATFTLGIDMDNYKKTVQKFLDKNSARQLLVLQLLQCSTKYLTYYEGLLHCSTNNFNFFKSIKFAAHFTWQWKEFLLINQHHQYKNYTYRAEINSLFYIKNIWKWNESIFVHCTYVHTLKYNFWVLKQIEKQIYFYANVQ